MTFQGDVEAMCIKVPIFKFWMRVALPFYANFYTLKHLENGE